MAFTAKATTAGNSKALRLDSALVTAHPELSEGVFTVHFIGPGTFVIVKSEKHAAAEDTEDPVLSAFLAFLDRDMKNHPERIRPMTSRDLVGLQKLLEGVVVDRDEDLGDYTLP
jgi:antitoxin PrlF